MTKARDLGKLVSQGEVLADGVVQAAEVTGLASVATSGSYTDLTNKPTIPTVPTLAAVATSGSYADLTNKPTLAAVSTTGSYADLTNKPTIPSVSGLASETFVNTQINNLVNAAPATLDTLKEIADQLAIDQSATAAITTALAGKANTSSLSTIATTGSYTDLTNKPTIPTLPTLATVATTGSYTDLINKPTTTGGVTSYTDLTNKPTFATVATTGSYTDLINKPVGGGTGVTSYTDLTDKPTFAAVATTGSYADLTNKPTIPVVPTLAAVATSGSYADLTNKPTIPSGSYTDLTNKPVLASVATSGSYADLTNKPTIPTVPTLATVATTGSYTDLINKPVVATLKVTSIAYPGDDLAANPVGGQTITLTGTGFTAGLSVLVDTTVASVVTVVSSTTVTFTAPAKAAGTYVLYLVATDGSVALSLPGISYSGVPAWSTGAGTLGTQYETTAISKSLSATSTDGAVTYSLVSGTLPPGSSLNTSTGAISGTAPATNSSTTYNFTIRATDAQNQDTDRAFSITLDPDSVTWSNPATNLSVTADVGAAYSQALAAASAAGNSVSYSSTELPAGVTLTGSTLSGTFTSEQTVATTVTATAANSSRTATRTITFNIATGAEPYFKNVSLLLTGNGTFPESKTYTVTNSGASDYLIDGVGDPTLTLIRGSTYTFTVSATGHPFWIKTSQVTGTASSYNTGVTNNGTQSGTITFVVPSDAPSTLYYICQFHGSMTGTINVVDASTNNNTFLDSSINNRTITRNGNTTQGSFSPYGSNWSNYFNGTSTIAFPSNSAFAFGTGAYTVEMWVFITGVGSGGYSHFFNAGNATGSFGFAIDSSYALGVFNYGTGIPIPGSANDITPNQWQHIAVCRSSTSSNDTKIYVNGVLKTTGTDSTNWTVTTTPAVGGITNLTGYSTIGYISNCRVVKGTAVYTSAFTPSTTPLTAISGTSLLTCADNRFVDDSTNNFAITANGTPSVQRFNPFGASTAYSTSVIGGSGYFDGNSGHISTTVGPIGTQPFTFECWLYNTVQNNQPIFTLGGYQSGIDVRFDQISSDVISGYIANTGYTFVSNPTPNQWAHFALTRDSGNNVRAFYNGVLMSTAAGVSANITSTDLRIGALIDGGVGGNQKYTGYISDFRYVVGTAVYTANFTPPTAPLTAVTNTQLLLKFTNAGIIDNAMMNDLETVGNAQISTSVVKYGTGSLAFDGTGDYLKIPYSPNLQFGTGAYTLEFWLNTSSVSQWLVFNAETDTGIRFYVQSNGTLELDEQVANVDNNIYSTATVNDGAWHHIALSRASGAGTKMFVDGVYQSQQAAVYNFSNASPYYIGVRSSLSGYLTGYIDDLRITKGYARYTANFTPPTSGFKDK